MPKQRAKRLKMWRWIVAAVAVLVLMAVALHLRASPTGKPGASNVASVTPTASLNPTGPTSPNGGGRGGEPTTTPTPTPSTANTPPATLTAPILEKSSGNNGPVPSGAVVEFVCRSTTQYDCVVKLVNKTNGQVLDLGKKATQSDGHDGYGATWNWKAVNGNWAVTATASQSSATAASEPQTLMVQ